jgi:hypothetical protein
MNTRTDELTEARAILRALERCELRNDGDRRFLDSWRGYLARSRGRADWRVAASAIAPRGSRLRHLPGRRTDGASHGFSDLKDCLRALLVAVALNRLSLARR